MRQTQAMHNTHPHRQSYRDSRLPLLLLVVVVVVVALALALGVNSVQLAVIIGLSTQERSKLFALGEDLLLLLGRGAQASLFLTAAATFIIGRVVDRMQLFAGSQSRMVSRPSEFLCSRKRSMFASQCHNNKGRRNKLPRAVSSGSALLSQESERTRERIDREREREKI